MPPGVEVSYRLFSGGGDALIKSWDLQTGDVSSMCGHTQEVVSVVVVATALHSGCVQSLFINTAQHQVQ